MFLERGREGESEDEAKEKTCDQDISKGHGQGTKAIHPEGSQQNPVKSEPERNEEED